MILTTLGRIRTAGANACLNQAADEPRRLIRILDRSWLGSNAVTICAKGWAKSWFGSIDCGACGTVLLYAAYESLMPENMNIRVDRFMLWPSFLVVLICVLIRLKKLQSSD
jgi:hypothetical protein